jgi:hypothetical protein
LSAHHLPPVLAYLGDDYLYIKLCKKCRRYVILRSINNKSNAESRMRYCNYCMMETRKKYHMQTIAVNDEVLEQLKNMDRDAIMDSIVNIEKDTQTYSYDLKKKDKPEF